MNEAVHVVMMDLPPSVHGFSRHNADDTYTIVLNDSLCREGQRQAYLHEIEHIKNGDFQEAAVGEIELIRHEGF